MMSGVPKGGVMGDGQKDFGTLLVVGGDTVASIWCLARLHGVGRVLHWSGRKPGDVKKRIPSGTGAVVIVLDRVSHGLAQTVRRQAKRQGLPIFFRGRAVASGAAADRSIERLGALLATAAGDRRRKE